jgi:cytochrome oxidase Cu insertion factor (SCO1/SenC/PrrC family)
MVAGVLGLLLAVVQFALPPMQIGDTLPPTALRDQNDAPLSTTSLRGNVTLVAFMYTRCPEMTQCPAVTAKFATMARTLRPSERIRLLEITLDPAHDTPTALTTYARSYGRNDPRWSFATGAPQALVELQTRLGVSLRATPDGRLVHEDRLLLFDDSQRLAATIEGTDWAPLDAVARARGLATQRFAPLATVRLWLTSAIATCGASAPAFAAWVALVLLVVLGAIFGLAMRRALRSTP